MVSASNSPEQTISARISHLIIRPDREQTQTHITTATFTPCDSFCSRGTSGLIASSTYNVPILSIIGYAILSVLPHAYAIQLGSQGDLTAHNNANPKSSDYVDVLKKKLGPKRFAAFERAESCHRNHLENAPLFIATVFAGYLAEEQLKGAAIGGLTADAAAARIGLDAFVVAWLTIRVLYTFNYLATETQAWSYVRSLLYFVGTGWAFTVLGRAAEALN